VPTAPSTATARELAATIDHTRLAPQTTAAEVEQLCAEAREHGFAAVCVNGVFVPRCVRALAGSAVRTCTVVGFPLGAMATRAKREEARIALDDGARELDMVLQLGALLDGDLAAVARDIEAVVAPAHGAGARVKVILETGLLARESIVRACRIAAECGADFVKTSTGFGPRGATCEDIELMRASVRPLVGDRMGIKAAGGIRTAAQARALLAAGATRLGTSAGLAILAEARANDLTRAD
jgi:deoxyribose-phosphate aldolase